MKTIKTNKNTLLFFLSIIFLLVVKSAMLSAQVKKEAVKPVVPVTYKTKSEKEIDSLHTVIETSRAANEKLSAINNEKESIIGDKEDQISKLKSVNDDLTRRLSSYKGENLKLDQSNRILIIFNTIVGILLLSTLVWFLRNISRRKASEKIKTVSRDDVAAAEISSSGFTKTGNQYFESKLEQLEKLGKLKEKGILNDEEFNKQKQQVLGSN